MPRQVKYKERNNSFIGNGNFNRNASIIAS